MAVLHKEFFRASILSWAKNHLVDPQFTSGPLGGSLKNREVPSSSRRCSYLKQIIHIILLKLLSGRPTKPLPSQKSEQAKIPFRKLSIAIHRVWFQRQKWRNYSKKRSYIHSNLLHTGIPNNSSWLWVNPSFELWIVCCWLVLADITSQWRSLKGHPVGLSHWTSTTWVQACFPVAICLYDRLHSNKKARGNKDIRGIPHKHPQILLPSATSFGLRNRFGSFAYAFCCFSETLQH